MVDWIEVPHRRPLLTLTAAVLVSELVGVSGSVFTAMGLESWYAGLESPALAPPNWVFGPVWTTLFALMGGAVWLVWRQARVQDRNVRIAVGLFAGQFVLNVAWSAAFFGARSITAGLAGIVGLWLAILATIGAFARVDRWAAVLLIPYLLWVSFAAYLNYRFLVLN